MLARMAVVLAVLTAVLGGPTAQAAPPRAPISPACVDRDLADGDLRANVEPDPVAKVACPGVRPGGMLITPNPDGDGTCTIGFLFTATAADGTTRRFIGTAGHCVLEFIVDKTWAFGDGPVAQAVGEDGTPDFIGHYVYAVYDVAIGRDFALIELLPHVEVNPQLCYWGGPVGIFNGTPKGELTKLRQFGHSVFATIGEARTGYANDLSRTDQVWMAGAAMQGDSGGPVVLPNGEALGVLVAIGGMATEGMMAGDAGFLMVQRLDYELQRAEAALGVDLQMLTAPAL